MHRVTSKCDRVSGPLASDLETTHEMTCPLVRAWVGGDSDSRAAGFRLVFCGFEQRESSEPVLSLGGG